MSDRPRSTPLFSTKDIVTPRSGSQSRPESQASGNNKRRRTEKDRTMERNSVRDNKSSLEERVTPSTVVDSGPSLPSSPNKKAGRWGADYDRQSDVHDKQTPMVTDEGIPTVTAESTHSVLPEPIPTPTPAANAQGAAVATAHEANTPEAPPKPTELVDGVKEPNDTEAQPTPAPSFETGAYAALLQTLAEEKAKNEALQEANLAEQIRNSSLCQQMEGMETRLHKESMDREEARDREEVRMREQSRRMESDDEDEPEYDDDEEEGETFNGPEDFRADSPTPVPRQYGWGQSAAPSVHEDDAASVVADDEMQPDIEFTADGRAKSMPVNLATLPNINRELQVILSNVDPTMRANMEKLEKSGHNVLILLCFKGCSQMLLLPGFTEQLAKVLLREVEYDPDSPMVVQPAIPPRTKSGQPANTSPGSAPGCVFLYDVPDDLYARLIRRRVFIYRADTAFVVHDPSVARKFRSSFMGYLTSTTFGAIKHNNKRALQRVEDVVRRCLEGDNAFINSFHSLAFEWGLTPIKIVKTIISTLSVTEDTMTVTENRVEVTKNVYAVNLRLRAALSDASANAVKSALRAVTFVDPETSIIFVLHHNFRCHICKSDRHTMASCTWPNEFGYCGPTKTTKFGRHLFNDKEETRKEEEQAREAASWGHRGAARSSRGGRG
ncbi:hypothetical protein BDZ89DRAFT_1084010 [Hymenopellis radicata]|nr:hypothetical protein BDZ89DRAFT_1084010 [Hymenopellis radicata]